MKTQLLFFALFFSFIFSFAQPDTLTCNVYGNPSNGPQFWGTSWLINSELQDYSGCGSFYPAIHVGIIDTSDCTGWKTCELDSLGNFINPVNVGQYNSCGQCRNRPEGYFIFNMDPSTPDQFYYLDSLLSNTNLGGVYFLVYTWIYADRDNIMSVDPGIYTALTNLGATSALIQADSVPFIFFAKQGDPSSAIEVIGATDTSFITLQALICNSTISSISKEEKKNDFTIFPNPATDMVTIEYNSKENANLSFYDITGRKVMEKGINPGEQQKINIDISVLPDGLYYVFVLQDEEIIKTEKIIVIK